MALSRHKGSLKDFLEHYEQTSVSSRQSQTTNSASRNSERQSDAYAQQPADKQRVQESKQQKQARREAEKQRKESEKKRKEAEKQHRKELKQQQKELARQRRDAEKQRKEDEKKRKEAEKQHRKELKQQQKALRKARFRSWLGRLKSRAGRTKQAIVETIAAVYHSASAPVKMTAEKARKLFAPKQTVKMQPVKTAEGLELGTQQKSGQLR